VVIVPHRLNGWVEPYAVRAAYEQWLIGRTQPSVYATSARGPQLPACP